MAWIDATLPTIMGVASSGGRLMSCAPYQLTANDGQSNTGAQFKTCDLKNVHSAKLSVLSRISLLCIASSSTHARAHTARQDKGSDTYTEAHGEDVNGIFTVFNMF